VTVLWHDRIHSACPESSSPRRHRRRGFWPRRPAPLPGAPHSGLPPWDVARLATTGPNTAAR
jgi:hypothetical protein